MDRIFFSSPYSGENGPSEVNRNLVENFPDSVSVLHSQNRYLIRLETIIKIFWCRVLIISALGQKDYEVRLAKSLGKKIIYIMHGFAEDDSEYLKARQDYLFPRADLILCVSEPFKNQVALKYLELTSRLGVLTNGIAWEKINDEIKNIKVPRDNNEIVLIGGGRVIKKNLNICRAIQRINDQTGSNYHVSVYGQKLETDESCDIEKIPCVSFCGLIPHEELLRKFSMSNLFVQGSSTEPFSLGVVEALACGCNLVVSQYVGALSVISAIKKEEIVFDPDDIEEITERILWVLGHPNNERLLNSIDREQTSLKVASRKLIEMAKNVINDSCCC